MEVDKIPENESVDLNEEKVLFEWSAPERAYQRKTKDFWVTAVAILILVSVILIFIKEFFLIMALISVLFLAYALSSVPPGTVKNKLTNRGLYFGELRYEWAVLKRFWFKKSLSNETICFGTSLRFPQQISLVIDPKDQEKLKEIVIKRIPMLESSPTFVDRLTKWFAARLPLEDREGTKKGN
ncbi:MAG: hypothetical protein US68_C0007G0014 [Candidatus Shapirobacteria bacterium GW2011_GWE1_38_10]|uniref:DUF5673 domain-containing protein n=1 Tax=Candidatus Shapirobacteria bacterium GW2011_GWE1_38_10 TaxID=1618488 RepID=A0A0G0LC83_9BACT|nr:MAG: hypothetical protein US46_C0007G0006 [Candidatus Shapirobacteria bacterium GW2011_GWF2_37_20]KKQ50251.1 MAG: hypothetical protein US68_C0007G0014 [Candidatus Shapirobacteria bacterium GW2011_GWE1_38_10]KKQ64785.1 MAG: hypothetical protein US85_C0003G0007 [Candidatus Shapirobacteria bacterium GW2011_GWF1_38_23]HBP50814.1 hypothetical protein [Candidatus Shapirobacteria bacterium]